MDNFILQGIGSTILIQTCSNALYVVKGTPRYKTQRYWENLADYQFIVHGSGLVKIANNFCLDIDAEEMTRIFLERARGGKGE